MEAFVTLIFLITVSRTIGQLIVPQDIAIGQQQGTLSGLTQFGAQGSDVINGLASPQEILVESLAPTHHESQKSNTIQKKFPVVPTSDLLGVADVQKPMELTDQDKPPDLNNKHKFAPLPLGVDFLSTSISSQEIIEMPTGGGKKDQGLMASRSWKNLVQSNPRQVGDRFDIVIEKRMKGNELSPSAKNSKSKKINLIKDVPVNSAKSFLHEPDLPWLNAAVELTPEHTWTENTIVRSSIGPMEMAEISTNEVKVRKAKVKSNVKELIKTTTSNSLDVSSTPNPVAAMNSNTEAHVTHSFHLKTTNKKVKKPATPNPLGWTSWVEPVATDTSPSWFERQDIIPDKTTDGKLITLSDGNSLQSPTEVTKEKKTTLKPVINDLPVELPTENVLQKSKSKGFFANWSPWTGTHEQTTHPNVEFTDTSSIAQQEAVPLSSVTSPTPVKNTENAQNDITSDVGNQIGNRELNNIVQNTEYANQAINSDQGNQIIDRELVNNVQNTEITNQGISSDHGNQIVDRELVNNIQTSEITNPGINSDHGNQIDNQELANNVQNTANVNQVINSDPYNQIVDRELANNVQITENANQGINADHGNQIVDRELVNNVHTTENANQAINADHGNQIVDRELVKNVHTTENANQGINLNHDNKLVNAAQDKQMVNHADVENIVNSPAGKEIINPEELNKVLTTETGRQEVTTEPVKQALNTVFDSKSTKVEVANKATSSKVLETLEILNSYTLPSDELKDVIEPKHSKSKSPFENLNKASEKKAELSANTINKVEKVVTEPAEETTMPPTSNFDPLLLPSDISTGVRHGIQQEEIDQTSNPQFGISNTHLGTSSSTVLDHNEQTGILPSLGRSSVSHPKRRFFVSPSPSDLIPPQEHLHEGVLFPIEPHIPSPVLDKEHSASHNSNKKQDQRTFVPPSHNGHVDMTDSLTHEDIRSEKVPLQPKPVSNSPDKTHNTHTVKSGTNANGIWNTRTNNIETEPAEFVRSDHLATSKDEEKERIVLLEQIKEALINLNGATAMMKPLDDISPVSTEPGLTHALIGSVNDFVDIPRTDVANTKTTDVRGSGTRRSDDQQHHLFEKHMDKNLFNDHNSFHKEHGLTDLSGHITLDEKAIRQKLLSPDTRSTFNHFPLHEGHNTHHSFHSSHMGLTDSLGRADVDLSQDLSKSPMLDTPITIRNLQRHIEETNRESAKLRFFMTPNKSENVINSVKTPKSKREKEQNKPSEGKNSEQPITTQIPSTKSTKENGVFINNNSIFFDPDTNKPVDPFNNVSSDVFRNAHHAWEDAVANVKTHIDPIPEIAAVVGDKKNAVRVGSVSAFRVGEIPPSLKQDSQPPQDPNAAFHFLDPVTNDVVPIAALPDDSSNNNEHAPTPHQPNVPGLNQMFGHALSNGENPTIPFINPMASAGDMNSEDGFFVGPILFGPVDDPPPNGDIEISGPVLAMGIAPGDDQNGNHGPQGIDVNKILQGIFKNNKNTKKNTFNPHLSPTAGSLNHTSSKLKHVNRSKPKPIKPISLGRVDVNPLKQMLGGSKQARMLPSTHFPDSSLGHRTVIQTSENKFHAPNNPSTHPKISKTLWNALVNILKANKRKEFLSNQKVKTSFQKSFPSTVPKHNIMQRPAQMKSNKANKLDVQKIINIMKARQKLFGQKKKLTAPRTIEKHHSITGISKSPLGARSQVSNRSIIKPIATTKHESIPTLRSANSERMEHLRSKRYQLLLRLMKNRRFKNNHMMPNVQNIRSNLRPSHINSVARPAQRTIGHSSVNTDTHRFIPKFNSAHRSSVVRPIPLSTIHQWPFSAPVGSQLPSMNNQHFLPRHRVWPQNQIHYVTSHVFI